MNKKLPVFTASQQLSDLMDKMASKWRLGTQKTQQKLQIGETPEDILRDIIGMPTVTGNTEALHDALNYIETFLQGRGMHVTRLESNGVESLVATSRPTKTPAVFLAGHIDVVPGEPDQFELRIADSKYFGRGMVDMKMAIAAYLSVIKALPDPLSNYDFGIMVMTDEEVGGYDGAAIMAEQGYASKVMVLPDGGGGGWWNIERLAKGIWHVTIEAGGVSAHGSRPWEGSNAIDTLLAGVAEIKALFPAEQGPETSTINIGTIQGGEAINQIPASANVSFDMRFIDAADQRRVLDAVTRIVKAKGLTIVSELHADTMTNDPEHPLLKTYVECVGEITGKQINWVISNAGSDGRFFTDKGTVSAVSYPEGGGHHGPSEWATIESYEQLQQIVRRFLDKVAKQ